MTEKPSLQLLDRQEAGRALRSRLQPQLEALDDMVSYGSRLIQETFESGAKTPVDVVVLGVLLKQIVAMADSVVVQLREGVVHPAFLQVRAALEALLYLEWILAGDSKFKANCYIVSNMRHNDLWASRDLQGSPEARAFGKAPGEIGVQAKLSFPLPENVAELDPDKTYQSLTLEEGSTGKAGSPGPERRAQARAQWFNLAGANSLRRIAQQVGRLQQYHFQYAQGSHVTHHTLYKDHVRVDNGQTQLREIRDGADADELVQSMMQIALGAFVSVLKQYRPEELAAFGKTYAELWRSQFLAIGNPPQDR